MKDHSKHHCMLYRKGTKLQFFRIWRWLFTEGLEMFLQYSMYLWIIPCFYAWKFQDIEVARVILPGFSVYTIVVAAAIWPKTGSWYRSRRHICDKWFLNMVADVVADRKSPELRLTKRELQLMESHLNTSKVLEEASTI